MLNLAWEAGKSICIDRLLCRLKFYLVAISREDKSPSLHLGSSHWQNSSSGPQNVICNQNKLTTIPILVKCWAAKTNERDLSFNLCIIAFTGWPSVRSKCYMLLTAVWEYMGENSSDAISWCTASNLDWQRRITVSQSGSWSTQVLGSLNCFGAFLHLTPPVVDMQQRVL